MHKFKIHTDGASRGNPGLASFGFVIKNDDKKIIHKDGQYIGLTTNNVAEYTAVLKAFEWVKQNYDQNIFISVFADSQLLVRQLSGLYKIKSPHLKQIFDQIKDLENQFEEVTYTHVPREENKEADRMANIALDSLNSQ